MILNDRTRIHQLEGQRNFWICLLLFVLWSLVYMVLKFSDKIVRLEAKVTQLEETKKVNEEPAAAAKKLD